MNRTRRSRGTAEAGSRGCLPLRVEWGSLQAPMRRRSGLQVGEEGGVQGRGPGCSEGMEEGRSTGKAVTGQYDQNPVGEAACGLQDT